MSLAAGQRLGPYEIASALGAGGMSEVWRARDTRLDREVAIEVLPAGLAQDEQFRQRFDREAKVISSLDHPNICTLFDAGEAATSDDRPALTEGGISPWWSADGRRLCYLADIQAFTVARSGRIVALREIDPGRPPLTIVRNWQQLLSGK